MPRRRHLLLAAFASVVPLFAGSASAQAACAGATSETVGVTKVVLNDGCFAETGDRYTAYVNRDTGLMDRWAFILQDMPKDGPASPWLWQGWQKYGNIMLAPHRAQVGGDRKLELSDIAVTDKLPESVFTSPDPVK